MAATSTETPDGLEIALDKENYAPGEVAKLKVSPRFAGELLVTVGAEKLLATLTATVPEGGATVDIPVGADWGAGAYVTATLYRPGEAQESRMPARAIGVKWLEVDPGAKQARAWRWHAPNKSMPRETLSVPVAVTGAAPGSDAYVMIAAVDVGILNLTRYKAPDPEAWFFGQRMLGLEMRDLYGRLIDGSLGATGRLRTGGDGARACRTGQPADREAGGLLLRPGASSTPTARRRSASTSRSSTARSASWLSPGRRTPSAMRTQDVIVRDPVVVTASLPRFLAPGDGAVMRLDVANTDGPDGD